MKELAISGYTQAEKDKYLFECFHDSGFLEKIIKGEYSIIAGRTGTGKTAIARFLEEKYEDYGLFTATRISITAFTPERLSTSSEYVEEKILIYILLKTVRHLLEENLLSKKSKSYWEAVFKSAGMQAVNDYKSFVTTEKENFIGLSMPITGQIKETLSPQELLITSENIFHSLITSLEDYGETVGYLMFVDDLSDYLDDVDSKQLKDDIQLIKEVVTRLDLFNTELEDKKKGLRFVSCIRDDLFEWMEGSNINKLRSSALFLKWDEKSFASLLIRRLPYFRNDLEAALADPIDSLRAFFPDEIFQERLQLFEVNRYHSNFYAYMVAISFNRPRDFLAFCHSMEDRLSTEHEVAIENIDSAEIEYTEYFTSEVKDELYLASRVLDFPADTKSINSLIDLLAKKEGFSSAQLRTDLASFLDEKTSVGKNKIEKFIYNLWWYGILGFKEKKTKFAQFKYVANSAQFIQERTNEYGYFLHRGLWWFTQKRRGHRQTER